MLGNCKYLVNRICIFEIIILDFVNEKKYINPKVNNKILVAISNVINKKNKSNSMEFNDIIYTNH